MRWKIGAVIRMATFTKLNPTLSSRDQRSQPQIWECKSPAGGDVRNVRKLRRFLASLQDAG